MLNSIFNAATFSATYTFLAMIIALFLGATIGVVYMMTGSYRKNFVVTLTILPVLVCMIIMIVNGNVGASVATLGAFGLVRFRSTPGSAQDIGFIFYSMTIGLTIGLGFLTLAVLVTLVVGAAFIVLTKSGFGNENLTDRALRITVPEDLNYMGAFEDLFDRYTQKHRLVSVKTTNMGTMYELRYDVLMYHNVSEKAFLDELRCRNGNLTIILGLNQRDSDTF